MYVFVLHTLTNAAADITCCVYEREGEDKKKKEEKDEEEKGGLNDPRTNASRF